VWERTCARLQLPVRAALLTCRAQVRSHRVCRAAIAGKSGRFATGAAGARSLPAHPTCGYPAASLPDLFHAHRRHRRVSLKRTSNSPIRLQREFLPAAAPVVARSCGNEQATLAKAYRQVERREREASPQGCVVTGSPDQRGDGKYEQQRRQDDANRSPSDNERMFHAGLHAAIFRSGHVKKRYRAAACTI